MSTKEIDFGDELDFGNNGSAPVAKTRDYNIQQPYDRTKNPLDTGTKMLKSGLAGLYTIPEVARQIDIKKRLPFVGMHPTAGTTIPEAYTTALGELQDPNFVEGIATDPLTYMPTIGGAKVVKTLAENLGKQIPAVGGLVNKGVQVARHAIDPLTQSVLETTKEGSAGGNVLDETALGTVGSMALGKTGTMLGKGMKESALSGLTTILKLLPSDLRKKFAPEVEVLFKDKLIPFSGGSRGILEKVEQVTSDANEARNQYLHDLLMQSKEEARKQGRMAHDIGDLPNMTVNIDDVQDDALRKLKAIYNESGINPDDYKEQMEQIVREAQSMKLVNPLQGISDDAREDYLSEFINRPFKHEPAERNTDWSGINEDDLRIIHSGKNDLIGSSLPAISSIKNAPMIAPKARKQRINEGSYNENDIPFFQDKRLDLDPLIPISQASKRRTRWFNQGDVNKRENKDLPANKREAYNKLWESMSKVLNANPVYQGYSGKLAKYVPLVKALESRNPVIENKLKYPLSAASMPAWLVRRMTSNNPALRLRYDMGQYLMEHPDINLSKTVVPGADYMYNQDLENQDNDVNMLYDTYGTTK